VNMEIQPATALSVIDSVNLTYIQGTMGKIQQFQSLVQKNLKQNHDFGVIPGTPKPTLLKPGAEKILMLMGLTSEYELIERVQDYENGFFAFTVKCVLLKGEQKITEGVGHCNTKEKKYIKQDPFTLANTCLKMAKKRAQIDATLTVASLSEVFTQDIEDMDIQGNPTENSYNPKVDNPADVVLGFGKHKGKKLGEVPADYVEWIADNARDTWLKDAAKKLLAATTKEPSGQEVLPDEEPFETIDDEGLPF
jgi:hypothetical protein